MKKSNFEISGVFPVPVLHTSLDRDFTEEELKFAKNQLNDSNDNIGNNTSKNNYILEHEKMKGIKLFIEEGIQTYVDNIICPKDDTQVYITQSWINYNNENQYHHSHTHSNSYISGVFYFIADENFDSINFSNRNYSLINPVIKDFNIWNSQDWWFSVHSKKLILFPSSTTHNVFQKKDNNIRISLAFNTFVKGTIGSNLKLSELKL
tara:strand:- start:77 stop:697 length:621 start_codon:yes stop_codon:yes gene_type:complete